MSATIGIYADGHVDARGPGGFNPSENLPQNAVEALKSLAKTVDSCNDKGADLLLVAGDLFDTGKPTPEIVARVDSLFSRLDTTRVVLLDGNHDQQGVLSGHRTAIESYFRDRPWCVDAKSSPGVVEVDGLMIATLPWVRVSSSNALGATNEALERYVDEMASAIRPGTPSLLVGHLTVAECSFDSQRRGSEATMVTSTLEASIPTAVLDEGPWALARLGHIHKRQQLSEKTGYVGSPYKVSFGEIADSKGIDLVTLSDDNTASVEFLKFDVRELVKIDLTDPACSASSFAARQGDIVRLVANSHTSDQAEALARSFIAAGASAHIHRVPDELAAIKREAQYSTEMAPADALSAYLERKGIDEEKRPLIIAAFSDVSAACHH